jgi:hypothetical protein
MRSPAGPLQHPLSTASNPRLPPEARACPQRPDRRGHRQGRRPTYGFQERSSLLHVWSAPRYPASRTFDGPLTQPHPPVPSGGRRKGYAKPWLASMRGFGAELCLVLDESAPRPHLEQGSRSTRNRAGGNARPVSTSESPEVLHRNGIPANAGNSAISGEKEVNHLFSFDSHSIERIEWSLKEPETAPLW